MGDKRPPGYLLPGLRHQAPVLPRQQEEVPVRCDHIVYFEPFADEFSIMREAQTAKPQSFRTGDGWFAYNLAVNLAQM